MITLNKHRCRRIHLKPSEAQALYGVVESYLSQMRGYEGPSITEAERMRNLLWEMLK